MTKDYSSKADEIDHVYHIDNVNLEGFLDLKMPTIRESLMFTYKNFNGLPFINKSKTVEPNIKKMRFSEQSFL